MGRRGRQPPHPRQSTNQGLVRRVRDLGDAVRSLRPDHLHHAVFFRKLERSVVLKTNKTFITSERLATCLGTKLCNPVVGGSVPVPTVQGVA